MNVKKAVIGGGPVLRALGTHMLPLTTPSATPRRCWLCARSCCTRAWAPLWSCSVRAVGACPARCLGRAQCHVCV